MRAALVLLALLLCGCPAHVLKVCPRCEVLDADAAGAPAIRPGTRRVFVLVPGILGYGWEWNGVQIALRRDPAHQVLVLDWDPWQSLARGGEHVERGLNHLFRGLPPTVSEVVVIGHSVGGLVVTLAASGLRVPQGHKVRVATIGAPFAGTHISLFDYEGPLHSPSFFAIGGMFRTWPGPAPRVEMWVYPTGANDPVMRPRMGHDPGQRDALPKGARVCPLPPGMDHNLAVTWVAERLLAAEHGPLLACCPLEPGKTALTSVP